MLNPRLMCNQDGSRWLRSMEYFLTVRGPDHSEAAPIMELSAHDHDFLKAQKIKADENLPY
jgi:hypothetical protein